MRMRSFKKFQNNNKTAHKSIKSLNIETVVEFFTFNRRRDTHAIIIFGSMYINKSLTQNKL